MFFVSGGQWHLTIDRTNWKWGDANINILTLAIAFKGIAIPIYWELLDKRGNSDTQEQMMLLKKFISNFGKDCIAGLLSDRELFRGLKPMEERVLYRKREILGHQLYVAGLKLFNGDFLIVVTNENPSNAIKTYRLRWEIESLFSCLKGRGFNFEDTHITDQERIKKLFVLLAIAFCWAHKTGEWQHEVNPIKIKKHGRPAVSLFRYGLDYLVNAVMKIFYQHDLFKTCLGKINNVERISVLGLHSEMCG